MERFAKVVHPERRVIVSRSRNQNDARTCIPEDETAIVPVTSNLIRTWRAHGTSSSMVHHKSSLKDECDKRSSVAKFEIRSSGDEVAYKVDEMDSDSGYSWQGTRRGGWWEQENWSGSENGGWLEYKTTGRWGERKQVMDRGWNWPVYAHEIESRGNAPLQREDSSTDEAQPQAGLFEKNFSKVGSRVGREVSAIQHQRRSASSPIKRSPSRQTTPLRERKQTPSRRQSPLVMRARQETGHLFKWLDSLGGGGGALHRYQATLEDFFDTPEQVFLAYTTPIGAESSPPEFDSSFFDEIGVENEDDQLLFRHWFRSELESLQNGPSSGSHQGVKSCSGLDKRIPTKILRRESPSAVASKHVAFKGDNLKERSDADTTKLGAHSEAIGPGLRESCSKGLDNLEEKNVIIEPLQDTSNVDVAADEPTPSKAPSPPRKSALEDSLPTSDVELQESPQNSQTLPTRNSGSEISTSTPYAQLLESSLSTPDSLLSEGRPAIDSKMIEAKHSEESQIPVEIACKLRQIRDTSATLPDVDARQHVSVALLGHAGTGKSSLLGGLLHAAGVWDSRRLERYMKDLKAANSSDVRAENFATESRRFTLLDVSGQRRHIPQVCATIAQADVAILVVSAVASELEAGIAKGGQIREHAVLAKSAGIDRLIVAVNKMDSIDQGKWSSGRYEETRAELCSSLRTIGFQEDQLVFVPVSALRVENLSGGCEEGDVFDKCSGWYSNGALLQVLNKVVFSPPDANGPLCVSVTGRESRKGAGSLFAARIEQGVIEVGATAVVIPSGAVCGIQTIEVDGCEVQRAIAGELVFLRLLGAQPAIGSALSCSESPIRAATKFKAQIRLLDIGDDVPIITPGFRCMLHLHAVVAECEVSKLIEAADPRTKKKETPPKFVKAPMVVLCVLILTQEAEFPMDTSGGRFCRFSLRTDGATIAIGKVAELPKVK